MSKIRPELGGAPREDFAAALDKTVDWYIANRRWWAPLRERVAAPGLAAEAVP